MRTDGRMSSAENRHIEPLERAKIPSEDRLVAEHGVKPQFEIPEIASQRDDSIKVGICTPTMGSVPEDCVAAMDNFLLNVSELFRIQRFMVKSCPVGAARNALVQMALDNNCTHILFIDADMIPSPRALPDLLAWDKDIISGLCFHKTPPYHIAARKKGVQGLEHMSLDDIKSEIVEVAAIGMAFALIRAEVFRDMPSPWFDCRGGVGCGEDIDWSLNVSKLGYKIFLDPHVEVGHFGVISDRRLHEAFINTFGLHGQVTTPYGINYKW